MVCSRSKNVFWAYVNGRTIGQEPSTNSAVKQVFEAPGLFPELWVQPALTHTHTHTHALNSRSIDGVWPPGSETTKTCCSVLTAGMHLPWDRCNRKRAGLCVRAFEMFGLALTILANFKALPQIGISLLFCAQDDSSGPACKSSLVAIAAMW